MTKKNEVVVKTTGTEVNPFAGIDPEFLNMAKEAASTQGLDEVSGSGYYYITLAKNGKFQRGRDNKGEPIYLETPFKMVVMSYGSGRRYFKDPYKKGEVKSPDCWVTSTSKSPNNPELVPNVNSADKQSNTCATCPHFAFGGECDPEYRLAVFGVSVDDEGNRMYDSKHLSIARLSPTSLKKWNAYVKTYMKNVAVAPGQKQDLPSYFFIIEVTSVPVGDEGYHVWDFRPTVPVDREIQEELRERITEAEDVVTQGYALRGSNNDSKEQESQADKVTEEMESKV